jgi:pyruvate,water dikinase
MERWRTHSIGRDADEVGVGKICLSNLSGFRHETPLLPDGNLWHKLGVRKMIADAISVARENKRKTGLCGQAPSDFPEFAQFLVENRIDSVSFNPDAFAKGMENILKAEKKLKK